MLCWNEALFLVYLLLPTVGAGNDTQQDRIPCTHSFAEFESATVGTNTRSQLHDIFYKPNHHLPHSVIVSYQLVLANGTRLNLSSDQDCSSELWAWLSSPVFLLGDVTYINRYLLYTLNSFTDWHPTHVVINSTTAPCPAKMEDFLCKMTASVSLYDYHNHSCMIIINIG